MKFEELPLAGARLVHGVPRVDQRGFFERVSCAETFTQHGLPGSFPQINISSNELAGTRRGLHFQREPHIEAKLIRCLAGALYDVIVDIRKNSSTFGQWHAVVLNHDEHTSLFVPAGFAHGFQTLVDGTTLLYLMSASYHSAAAAGIATDDPDLKIEWPGPAVRISAHDMAWPSFRTIC